MSKKISLTDPKKQDKKADIAKPFQIGYFRFFACCYPKNIKQGYKFYLAIKGRFGYMKSELDSPMFKNKTEAENFISNKKLKNMIPG